MKVAMYYNNNDVRIEEMPVPKIRSGEILMKIIASGICGSDVMEWYRIKSAPRVLGHEVAGEIVQVGSRVKKFKKGQRVFVTHHVPCYECLYCKTGRHTSCAMLHSTNFFPGGFSEFVRVPQVNVKFGTILLPKSVSFEEASFIEPLGCVVRAQRIAGMKKGFDVFVVGSGISGLLHLQLAKQSGAKRVFASDVNKFRLKLAKKFGAFAVFDAKKDFSKKLLKENQNKLADLVIVCTSSASAVKQALDLAGNGGTILFFAPAEPQKNLSLNLNNFWLKGLTITTSYAAANDDLKTALKLIQNKKINVLDMITHRFPLEQTAAGFKLIQYQKNSLKVIIKPFNG